MLLKFRDMFDKDMLHETHGIIITGSYNLFNNRLEDYLKNICRNNEIKLSEKNNAIMNEFFVGDRDSSIESSYISFGEFLEVVNTPNMNGKWYCSTDYKMMRKKEREKLLNYLKNPSKNGKLVIVSTEYQDYKDLLKNKMLKVHPNSHLIQLNFPSRTILIKIVQEILRERNVEVPLKAIELFIMRMGTNYDNYEEIVDKVVGGREGTTFTYSEFNESLKGVEYYAIDDFIERLLIPLKNKKITNRKIYKIMDSLIQDLGPKTVVNRVKTRVNEMIEMRILINEGIIPIKVKYSIKEVKERIGNKHALYKINDYSFKRKAILSSQASLRDLVFIKLMLYSIQNTWSEQECEKALYSILHRSVLNTDRLLNDINIKNTLEEQIYEINKLGIM